MNFNLFLLKLGRVVFFYLPVYLAGTIWAYGQQPEHYKQYLERQRLKKEREQVRVKALQNFLTDPCYCVDSLKCNVPLGQRRYYYQGIQYLSNATMNRLIRQDITKITLNQDGSPVIGNYASLQYLDNQTKVILNTSFYNPLQKIHLETDPIRQILSINIKAGIDNGSSTIFSGKNVSSGTSVKLKYSFLSPKTVYEKYSMMDCNDLKSRRTHLAEYYQNLIDTTMVVPNAKRQELLAKVNKARNAIEAFQIDEPDNTKARLDTQALKRLDIEKERRELTKKLSEIAADTTLPAEEKTSKINLTKFLTERNLRSKEEIMDSTIVRIVREQPLIRNIQRKALMANLITAEKEYRQFETSLIQFDYSAAVDSTYKLLYAMEAKDVRWDYYKVKWLDVDASLGGEKYQLFNSTLPVGQQLKAKPFTTWSGGFTFNYFESGRPGSIVKNGYFVQWGFHTSNSNNLVGASPIDVSTTEEYGADNKKTTTSEKKSAFRAPFKETFQHALSFRFSSYQNEKQSASLNFYSTVAQDFDKNPVRWVHKPDILLGTGYTLALLNKEKEKAFINIELFLNFTDVLNTAEADSKFYQRRELGVRVGIPFNSIFINK